MPTSAYQLRLGENRRALAKEAGSARKVDVAALAGEKCWALSAAAKKPFDDRAAKPRAQWAHKFQTIRDKLVVNMRKSKSGADHNDADDDVQVVSPHKVNVLGNDAESEKFEAKLDVEAEEAEEAEDPELRRLLNSLPLERLKKNANMADLYREGMSAREWNQLNKALKAGEKTLAGTKVAKVGGNTKTTAKASKAGKAKSKAGKSNADKAKSKAAASA